MWTPASSIRNREFHLSFNLGYPNAYDQIFVAQERR